MRYYHDFERMYENAVENNDTDLLAYFAKFGEDYRGVQNACRFEASRECGFTDEYHTNKEGWCNNGELDIIKEYIFNGRTYAEIAYAELPNGRWVCGSSVFLENNGYGFLPSVFTPSYPTKDESILAEIDRITDYIKKNSKKSAYINAVEEYRHKLYCEQISLF